jgi:cyclopropane-fatty-acyl-phospholipid synthase
MSAITLAEHGLLPDNIVRFGIRKLLKQRLKDEFANDAEQQNKRYRELLVSLRESPIAIETDAANEQHYEVPAEFYQYILGAHLKYSSCYWDDETANLDQAEAKMLSLTMERAQLQNDQHILELGCGWGSLTLWMAQKFPTSRITAVSNSSSQREYIEKQAQLRHLDNIKIMTCDVNQLNLQHQFDRIISVEMFEHMRNYDSLLNKVALWLKPEGKLFVHIFCGYPLKAGQN